MIQSYKEMIVWQKAMELCTEIYRVSRKFPHEELYALTNQIRRAAVSIPSNIAEGQARKSTPEFVNFLSIAKGSLAELETQMEIAVRLKYLRSEDISSAISLCNEIGKMLVVLMQRLQTNPLITNH